MNSQREIVASLKEYAFTMMINTDLESEHFFWKGQFLAYSNVLDMIKLKELIETRKRIDDDVKNLNVEQQKKLLNAIFGKDDDNE